MTLPRRQLRIIGILWLGQALVLPTAVQAGTYNKVVAVVVGISQYHDVKKWSAIPNAETDARQFAKALKARNADVRELYGKQASQGEVMLALERADNDLLKAGGGTRRNLFIFYFAGHGATFNKQQGYVIPYDGNPLRSSWIAMGTIKQRSQEMSSAKHQLFVFASCFGGTALRSAGMRSDDLAARSPAAEWLDSAMDHAARVAITAGRNDEEIPDGPEGQGSQFGNAVVQALEPDHGAHYDRGDVNRDGCVTAAELFAFVQSYGRTGYNTPQQGHFENDAQGEVMFCRENLEMKEGAVAEGPTRSAPSAPTASRTAPRMAVTRDLCAPIQKRMSKVLKQRGVPGVESCTRARFLREATDRCSELALRVGGENARVALRGQPTISGSDSTCQARGSYQCTYEISSCN